MAILLDTTFSDCEAAVGVGYADKNTIGVIRKGCSITSLGKVRN